MSKTRKTLPRLNKLDHSNQDEMMRRMRSFQKRLYLRELESTFKRSGGVLSLVCQVGPQSRKAFLDPKAHLPLMTGDFEMLDVLFIAIVAIFFALSLWYVRFCERI